MAISVSVVYLQPLEKVEFGPRSSGLTMNPAGDTLDRPFPNSFEKNINLSFVETRLFISSTTDVSICYKKQLIGVASITQTTHVRNKDSNIQGRSPNAVKVIFHTVRNCSERKEFASCGSKFIP